MTMDPNMIILLGGQVLAIIAALAAAGVAIINALRTKDLKQQQDVNVSRLNVVAADTEAIKGHVNSEKTASEGRERLLENENKMLKEMIADKRMTASLLAQASAQRGREAAAAAAPAPIDPQVLDSIDKNTADTAANTAKTEANTAQTDAKIDALKGPKQN